MATVPPRVPQEAPAVPEGTWPAHVANQPFGVVSATLTGDQLDAEVCNGQLRVGNETAVLDASPDATTTVSTSGAAAAETWFVTVEAVAQATAFGVGRQAVVELDLIQAAATPTDSVARIDIDAGGACTVTDLRQHLAADAAPTGAITMFAGAAAPDGYLLCQGQAVSQDDYSRLYDVIGGTFGEDAGAGTFNLPDLQQRFPVGVGAGVDYDLGDTGGLEEVDLSLNEMPVHSHSVDPPNTATTSNGSHDHDITEYETDEVDHVHNGTAYGAAQPSGVTGTEDNIFGTDHDGAHTHTINISAFNSGSKGGGEPHENRPPFIAINFIIKT